MMQASLGLLVSGQAQQGFSFLPSGPTGPSSLALVSLAASIPLVKTVETLCKYNHFSYMDSCQLFSIIGCFSTRLENASL